jgi:hypothetical protein
LETADREVETAAATVAKVAAAAKAVEAPYMEAVGAVVKAAAVVPRKTYPTTSPRTRIANLYHHTAA